MLLCGRSSKAKNERIPSKATPSGMPTPKPIARDLWLLVFGSRKGVLDPLELITEDGAVAVVATVFVAAEYGKAVEAIKLSFAEYRTVLLFDRYVTRRS